MNWWSQLVDEKRYTLWEVGIAAFFAGLLGVGGCAAIQPKLAVYNLPIELPTCSQKFRGKSADLEANGPFHDRRIVCLKKGDGSFAWFEVQVQEVN